MYSLIDIHLQLWLYSQGLESYLLIENGKVNIFFVLQPVEKIEKVGREYKVSYYDFVSERWVYEIITDERLLFTNKAGQCFIVRLGTLCFVDGIPVMRAHRIEGRGVNPARLLLRS